MSDSSKSEWTDERLDRLLREAVTVDVPPELTARVRARVADSSVAPMGFAWRLSWLAALSAALSVAGTSVVAERWWADVTRVALVAAPRLPHPLGLAPFVAWTTPDVPVPSRPNTSSLDTRHPGPNSVFPRVVVDPRDGVGLASFLAFGQPGDPPTRVLLPADDQDGHPIPSLDVPPLDVAPLQVAPLEVVPLATERSGEGAEKP